MVNRDEAKQILLSNNPELKIIYKDDELEKIVDGLCKDINYVRKTLKEVNMLIAKYEISNPEIAKLLIDKYYNFDEDELW
jgi:hypothetical protein